MRVCINLVFLFFCVTIVFCGIISHDEQSMRLFQKKDESRIQGRFLNAAIMNNINNETRLVSSRKSKGEGIKKIHGDDSEGAVLGQGIKKIHGDDSEEDTSLMSKILPMLVIPFILQTAIIPFILTMLKFMLLKSAFIGILAILLGIKNFLIKKNSQGGLYTHNVNVGHDHFDEHLLSQQHYGYTGGSEYGAYIIRKKRNT